LGGCNNFVQLNVITLGVVIKKKGGRLFGRRNLSKKIPTNQNFN
jgi:hypothetical protein